MHSTVPVNLTWLQASLKSLGLTHVCLKVSEKSLGGPDMAGHSLATYITLSSKSTNPWLRLGEFVRWFELNNMCKYPYKAVCIFSTQNGQKARHTCLLCCACTNETATCVCAIYQPPMHVQCSLEDAGCCCCASPSWSHTDKCARAAAKSNCVI